MKVVKLLSGALSATLVASMALVAYAEVQDIKSEQAQEAYAEQHQCMAMNIYHEARGDSRLGQKAVGMVTLNRVMHDNYPDTVCDVVYQARLDSNGNPRRNQCQFSWFCDGKSDTPRDYAKWIEVQGIAHEVLNEYGLVEDFTEGAIMYHASYVNPYWASDYDKTVRIDTHIFYK
jgi:spore germination cell wall hydrolase CwlJ-like protein